jgi:hypothetical protein
MPATVVADEAVVEVVIHLLLLFRTAYVRTSPALTLDVHCPLRPATVINELSS